MATSPTFSKLAPLTKQVNDGFVSYVDQYGNVYDPTYGGEMNDLQVLQNNVGGLQYSYDANGNPINAQGNIFEVNGQKYGHVYTPDGKDQVVPINDDPWADVKGIISTIGAAALGGAGAGSWLGGTLGLGTGALGSAAGGALIGGGLAGVTGQDVAKGALLGGLGGYVQGSGGVSGLFGGDTSLQSAIDADIAGGMVPEFGTNAAYDATMANLMANSPGAIAQLQGIVDNQVGGVTGPDNIDVGGGWNPAGVTTDTVNYDQYANPQQGTEDVLNKTSTSTIDNKTIADLAKAGVGLLGGSAAVKTLTGANTNPITSPTQGVPTPSSDYYNTIQQYYNAYMPNAPRNVAGPLEQWYNNSYGKAATTGSTTTPNTSATTAPVNTQANFKTAVPGAVAGLLTTPALAQASAVDKANLYNTMLSSGMSDAAIRAAVTERVGAQTNNDWNYLQGLGAAQALQGASITPQAVQNIQGLESGDKAIAYNSLLDSGLNDAQIRNLVESKMGAQTNNDWQYLTKMAGVQKVQYGTPIEKAQAYNEMLATGMNDADVRKLVEQAVGNQPDADWQYLKQLASSI